MFSEYKVAKLAYDALVEQTRNLQERVVLMNMVDASFGPDALPSEFGGHSILSIHRETTKDKLGPRYVEMFNKQIEANVIVIEEFEALFAFGQSEGPAAFAEKFCVAMNVSRLMEMEDEK